MENKKKIPVTDVKNVDKMDSANKELLKTLITLNESEKSMSNQINQQLFLGEQGSLIVNFNPKNHLEQIHRKHHE